MRQNKTILTQRENSRGGGELLNQKWKLRSYKKKKKKTNLTMQTFKQNIIDNDKL